MEEPDYATRRGLRLENVSTYDMFVYQHSFSKRDGDVKDNGTEVCSNLSVVDFGHEGPTFLTWHRYYQAFDCGKRAWENRRTTRIGKRLEQIYFRVALLELG